MSLKKFLLFVLQAHARELHLGGAQCSTSLDCWLNGDCVLGTCVCDFAWTGSTCNILSEQPAHQLWPPPDKLPANLTTLPSAWGSTIVRDDTGIYHMYVEVVCRFFTWMHIAGSVVVHATSSNLQGPYSYSDIALPQQSMTPHIVRDHDGAWLLLHQRNASVFGDPECTGEEAALAFYDEASYNAAMYTKSGPNSSEFDGPPSIARSTSLYGPWEPFDFVITPLPGTKIINPNPSLLPLSTGEGYLLAFVSSPILPPYSESVTFAHADDWRTGVFTPITGNNAPPPTTFLDCEDPFLWKSDRGLHVVCHRRASAPAPNPWNFTDVGGYGISIDGKNWTWSATPIYTTTIPWGEGESAGVEFQFGRRERPEFLLGPTGRPEYLINGVEFVTQVLGNPSMSIITPLGLKGPSRPLYDVYVTDKSATPILSKGLQVGFGHSPCNLTFNPAFLPAHPPGLNQSIAIVRVSGCPDQYGGEFDHLMYAECDDDGSKCSDLHDTVFPFEYLAEDPRIFFNPTDEQFYLFYFANGTNQSTVFLRRSPTPLIMDSWELLASDLPWHRNGCAFQANNGRFYVLYGETYANAYPGKYVEGIGIAEPSSDWKTFRTLNATLLEPANFGPEPEVCLEAATPPVQLSTGDWLHLFAAGTQGWSPKGPGQFGKYTAGWVVLDKDDPTLIVQRGIVHPFYPTTDYEIGSNPAWPVYRNNTLFVTSLVPVPGAPDVFRAWYGAADANVATAIVRVNVVVQE